MFDHDEASEFAGKVEYLSRTVEYLQLVAAQVVERSRQQARHAKQLQTSTGEVAAWRTGWTENVHAAAAIDAKAGTAASVLDDGFRNAAEFLRVRLRITIREARRRLALAGRVLPGTGISGEQIPPRHEDLAGAVVDAQVSACSATLISSALDRVKLLTDDGTVAAMEQALTAVAVESDPDLVARVARRWTDLIDQDGAEPTEEVLRQIQGAFIRKLRHGLQHLEIFATAEQFESLTTVMNAATNPRLAGPCTNAGRGTSTEAAVSGPVPELDRRSRAQKLLDGLVGGCKVALAADRLPANGGLKPQVMVTIDYRALFGRLQAPGSATSTFTGPIHPETIRKIACDADILPVLLGGEGQVLDIGRASRIFPHHIRKALTARDQGCAFPDCTMPAPWCEAHHITYWSQGGATSTDNGVLLCSHHHHVIHKEQWSIVCRKGVAWFTPPPHVDPSRTARRNRQHSTPLRR
ncbi:MAG TPA: DUF222 domain-containing protein [Paenarthrobacter sp.]|nr:DUF222 domain-containing protein [Paenarthrobacter sp.]